MLRKLKRQLFNNSIAPRPCHKMSGRLKVEALEDRLMPAAHVILVTNTHDAGAGSFRQAILDANSYTHGSSDINFDIPDGWPQKQQTIHLKTALPAITASGTWIDARGQFIIEPDSNPPPIVIDGSAVHDNPVGLDIKKGFSLILGLVIQNFRGNDEGEKGIGVLVEDGASVNLGGCYIGTDATGKAAAPNDIGVEIHGAKASAQIGSKQAFYDDPWYEGDEWTPGPIQSRNIISGNLLEGIHIVGASDVNVTNNYIGTDVTGSKALGNGLFGILLDGGANHVNIGYDPNESSSKYPNVISGNGNYGIEIIGEGATHNTIFGNFIGTDKTGKKAVPNNDGIRIGEGATYNEIGGKGAHQRNIISGNYNDGVDIYGEGAEHNHVVNNFIGLDVAGTNAIPNKGTGVFVSVGARLNTIGGLTDAERNVISGNVQSGIALYGFDVEKNKVIGNYLGTDYSGTLAIGNYSGILVGDGASDNSVGGDVAGSRNVISGNIHDGVYLDGGHTGAENHHAATNNRIWGNYIGIDKTGQKALGNGGNGVALGNGAELNLIGGNNAIGRNIIAGNKRYQVSIQGVNTSYNQVHNNYLGLDSTGTHSVFSLTSHQGSWGGVEIFDGATNNVIGGAPGFGNVIANSLFSGIDIRDAGTSQNSVNGNYIGLNAAGTLGQANEKGIYFHGGATDNTVGTFRRNVISGNNAFGVLIEGAGTSNNVIANNSIGLNVAGKSAVPNSTGVGIIGGASHNFVTGTDLGKEQGYNYISGNSRFGVFLSGAGTSDNQISQNYIGFDATQSHKAVGNSRHGVFLTDQAFDNYVGGTSSESANIIANNALDGVLIGSDPLIGYTSPAGHGNTVSGNNIYNNGKIGIDLGAMNGFSNNTLNAPAGPNDMLNHPELTNVYLNSAGVLNIAGNFYTQVTQTIKVEMYANPPGTTGQGKIYLGSFTFQATAFTISTFSNNLAGYSALLPVGTKITLTATDEAGNTSEFSLPMLVQKLKVKP